MTRAIAQPDQPQRVTDLLIRQKCEAMIEYGYVALRQFPKAERHVLAAEMRACLGGVALYQHEWDAYVSWAYNVGASAACSSTLVRKLRADPPDYPGACRELLRWDRQAGKVLPGLTRRRQAEYRQCMGKG